MKTPFSRLEFFSLFILLAIFLILLWNVGSSITRIPSGSVAIVQQLNGKINQHLVIYPGLYLSFPNKYLIVDTSTSNLIIKNQHPKDLDGATLKNLSVSANYLLDPGKIPVFFTQNHDLIQQPNGHYSLGDQLLQNSIFPDAIQIVTEKSNIIALASHPAEYALAIQKAAKARLDLLYPGNPFIFRSVTLQAFDLPDAIKQQVDAKDAFDARTQAVSAEKRTVEAQQIVTQEKAIVSASALSQAAKVTGLSVDQVIAWERVQALKQLAQQKINPNLTILEH